MADNPQSGAPAAPAAPSAAQPGAAAQPPRGDLVLRARPADNPNVRGHSPARDQREAAEAARANQPQSRQQTEPGQQQPEPQKIKIGDTEFAEDDVRSAMAERAERETKKLSMPKTPAEYKAELSAGFQQPEGMQFEIDQSDPALSSAKEFAMKHGLPQETFSELLDVYAASKFKELQGVNTARTAEMAKLGTAGPQRLDAVETWFKAKVGEVSAPMMAALRAYPVAATVKALEGVMRAFSGQGGSDFSQSHREGAPDPGKIPGFENMTFTQQRVAQMNLANAGQGPRRPAGPRG